MEIVTTAAGIIGRMAAKPLSDTAMRREAVIRALRAARLNPTVPPQDFASLYAYTLIEYCTGRSQSVLVFFRDTYVRDAFHRSFSDGDWSRLRRETSEAVERNRETREFGHLDHGFEEHVDGFIAEFHSLVDRSRAPHEARLEQKIDTLLERVPQTRVEEESHRVRTEPGRAELSPAQRLMQDAHEWFTAVGYEIRRTWEVADGNVAMLVDIPQRRPGRFDRTVMLCVEGELAPHHMRLLDELVTAETALEGWGLARLRVSEAARRQAADSGDVLFCFSFDELVDLEADFEPYIAWVEEEVRRRGIDSRYVPVSCRKEEIDPATQRTLDTSTYDWRDGGLDDYVAGWLEEPAKRHLSVLGEFGMGKSWFALHLAGDMARGWRDAKQRGVPRPRIPLLIPLRDYAKQATVQGLLSEFFFNKHKIDLRSYDVFRVLNRMGRLLLIFDGFDEMAARADRNTVIANFWELAGAVEPGAKVLLSSRKEHFRDAQEARKLFGGEISVPTAGSLESKDGPTFDIVELVRFDDEQIERMLRHDLAEDKVRLVMEHEDVRELMGRPVMSELVIDALPEIEQGAEINLARIYLYAVQRKMDRDVRAERTFTSRGDKLFFLCEVAWEMLSTNQLSLNYRDFPDRLRSCFGSAVQSAKDLDYWEQDMRNQGMLVRNAEGDYGPSHKSLLEFLVALKFAAELGLLEGDFLGVIPTSESVDTGQREWTWSQYFSARSGDGKLPALAAFVAEPIDVLGSTFGELDQNEAVYEFLSTMVRECMDHQERLLDVARATTGAEVETGTLAANCLNLIVFAGGSLEGARLRGLDLSGFGPWHSTQKVSLAGADLRDTQLGDARLTSVDLAGADLTGAWLGHGDLLDDGQYRQGLVHSSGAVVVHEGNEVLHWARGRIHEPPSRLPIVGDPHSVNIGNWDSATWWYSDVTEGRIIDAATGGVVGITIAGEYCIPIVWRDQQALAAFDPVAHALLVKEPGTGHVIDNLPLLWEGSGTTVLMGGSHGLVAMGWGEMSLRFGVATGEEGGYWRQLQTMDYKREATSRQVLSTKDSALLLVDGRPVAAVDALAPEGRLDDQGLPFPVPALTKVDAFVFRARSGMAAVAADNSLYGWSMGTSSQAMMWQIPGVPSGVQALWSPVEGDLLAVMTRMGELWLCDFRTGEVKSRTALGSRLRGTRFSRVCGLDEGALQAICRAGGVLVDQPEP
ncbi:NACHT domain-containing NTPase [Streptomyces sp. JHA26]|uniref:NACHT domain-containing protein n=1 Tax=Streptomyces sp. JHA26 TaxID=1917143 RepID=UPI000989ADFF|nr:NACHT domain-containing protein [Streptomyces sp. JHA26]